MASSTAAPSSNPPMSAAEPCATAPSSGRATPWRRSTKEEEEEEEEEAADARILEPSKDSEEEAEDARQLKRFVLNSETQRFLTDRTMWFFAVGFFLIIGPGEAFINVLGTVIKTLYAPHATDAGPTSAATHVSIVGITSTVVRLLTGSLTDVLAPSPHAQHMQLAAPAHALPPRTRFAVSRITFLLAFAGVLGLGLLALASGLAQGHGERFWIVSALVGSGYGAVFSLTPIIITVIWGVENFATNWGIVAMFPGARRHLLGARVLGRVPGRRLGRRPDVGVGGGRHLLLRRAVLRADLCGHDRRRGRRLRHGLGGRGEARMGGRTAVSSCSREATARHPWQSRCRYRRVTTSVSPSRDWQAYPGIKICSFQVIGFCRLHLGVIVSPETGQVPFHLFS